MTETIKTLNKYIEESEAILNKGNDCLIREQIIKIKNELGFKANLDNEYNSLSMWNTNIFKHKDKQILISFIKRMKNDYAKLIDEDNKQQNDYCLDKKRNRLTIICAIINAIAIVVGAVITFILSKFLS